MKTYIIWLSNFGFKGTPEENFWSEKYDAEQELRFDFDCGFHNPKQVADYVFENIKDMSKVHYVWNDGLTDDHNPIKVFTSK